MYGLLSTVCAVALNTGSAVTGVSPESFVASFQHVLAEETVEGEIKGIGEEMDSFVLQTNEMQSVTIFVNDKTSYTLDGEEATREDVLKVGLDAKVTHEDGLATSVAARSENPG